MKTDNCDLSRIREFLDGGLNDSILMEHLEECASCRSHLDGQVARPEQWAYVGRLLQPDEHDRATKLGFSAGSDAGLQARQSAAIDDVLNTLAPTDDPHRIGRLGNYEVMGVIGAGGMGVVLKAFESSLDRVVAIKVLAPHLANNREARQRFEREARAAAAVINPNVIPIYSVASDGALPYLVMAYIQGGSLQRRLDAQGAASVPEVLRIGSQIASGLAAAHEQGLVHRDIKPENILFEGDVERVAITDFGLARAVDDNTVTQAGTIAGTPMYMSPEQARGEQVDQQSDLFSLGSVLYALCTGQPPYRADSSLGVMRKITDEAPTPIRELNPEIPDWLSRLIVRLMARDKADRFSAASEVGALLEGCLSHVQAPQTVLLPHQLQAGNSRARQLVPGALIAFVAAIAFSALSGTWNGPASSTTAPNSNAASSNSSRNDEDSGEGGQAKTGEVAGSVAVNNLKNGAAASRDAENQQTSDVVEGSTQEKEKTLADLSGAEFASLYQQLTGVEPAFTKTVKKIGPSYAQDLNVLLDKDPSARTRIAKTLVEMGKPEIAEVVLSDGRVHAAATDALKMGDLLIAAGDREKAAEAYLEAIRIAPRLFESKHIAVFDQQDRLKDLAEVFTEERLRKTRGYSKQGDLLERLMKDDARASIGMPFMNRQWNARPDLRGHMTSLVPWNEVPNRLDYFRPLLIPENVETVGNGWDHLFNGGVDGGWVHWLRAILDADTVHQLIAEVRPKVQEHQDWVAGPVLLALLEARTGNYEPAKRCLEEHYKTVVTYDLSQNTDVFLADYAEDLGSMLQGKDRELDLLIIKLYEETIEHRNPRVPLRRTKLTQLARLYHKYDRSKDAVNLLYRLVEREYDVKEFLFENMAIKFVNLDFERIRDTLEATETLNDIGFPVDSLSLLSRIDFEMRQSASKRGTTDVDRATTEMQNRVTTKAIVEALSRGVLPVGLASTINEESGEIENPIIEVLEQVARHELPNETAAVFERVNPELTDCDAMDRHLADQMQRQPTDADVAVAAAILAFLRDDIDTARERLTKLASISEDQRGFRAADVNLYLAAEYGLEHEATADLAHRLLTRARLAGEQMNSEWKQFFKDVGGASDRGSERNDGPRAVRCSAHSAHITRQRSDAGPVGVKG